METRTVPISNDGQTSFYFHIDDGGSFGKLIKFIEDQFNKTKKKKGRKSIKTNQINLLVDSNYIYYYYCYQNREYQNAPPVYLICQIKLYHLTGRSYSSKKDYYVIRLDLDEFKRMTAQCNSSSGFFRVEKESESPNGLTIMTKPNAKSYLTQVDASERTEPVLPKYRIPKVQPTCVVTSSEFDSACNAFASRGDSTTNVKIYPHGLIFGIYRNNSSVSKDQIANGYIHILGNCNDEIVTEAYTYTENFKGIGGTSKLSSKGNVRIYVERDSNEKLLPIKVVFPIGHIGKGTFYIGINEYQSKES